MDIFNSIARSRVIRSPLVITTLVAGALSVAPVASSLQNILDNTHSSYEYGYPTDITRDILPVSSIAA